MRLEQLTKDITAPTQWVGRTRLIFDGRAKPIKATWRYTHALLLDYSSDSVVLGLYEDHLS
jgi:hypothetical protein